MAFFDYALAQMIEPSNLLVKIESILDWQTISDMLDKKLGKRDISIAGKIPYNSLSIFKIILVQQWHTLSDPKMEEALRTRIDFMWFTGFGLATNEFVVPDETTICRFRNKLIKTKLLGKLLSEVNKQLEFHKLKVRISEGAVLDVTLIEAAVNSRAKPQVIVEDRKENDDDNTGNPSNTLPVEVKRLSANDQSSTEIDKDAKWLKKGKKNIFGYKGFITTDATDGYIESIQVTAANISEVTNLEPALSGVNKTGMKVLYTDKGYASASNVEWLESNGIGNGIMDKAKRNAPLTTKQVYRNKRISKTRYIVERTNATVKNIFKFGKTRYLGMSRVTGQAFSSSCS
ncbi:MAG: hypothetical protein K0R14_243 [Burkholderiales bacterium]|jgi:IS5 family transposase|nr:hypothetical protein [Burkholderiales bacterium]